MSTAGPAAAPASVLRVSIAEETTRSITWCSTSERPTASGSGPAMTPSMRPLGLVVERVLPGVRDRAHGAQRCGPGSAEHPGQAVVVLVVDRRVVGLRHGVLAATVDGALPTGLMQMG